MWTFLQTYGSWILFGVLMLVMFRMHAGGYGCGGMAHHGDHGDQDEHSANQHEGYVVDADPPGGQPTTRWPVAAAADEVASADGRNDGAVGQHPPIDPTTAAARGDPRLADRELASHTSSCH